MSRKDIGNTTAMVQFDTPLLSLNRCRRCGDWIEETRGANKVLWCDTCRKLVDKELSGKTNRPFDYFFEYYQSVTKKRD